MGARPVMACGGPIAADKAPWWLGAWIDNGKMIEQVARLGYLDGTVLDATYGRGTFWKHHRPGLLANDRDAEGLDIDTRYDYRDFPIEWERSFDSVVFDPDYKLNGTPALGEFDRRYGIHVEGVTREMRYGWILSGASECARVARRYLLVKCQDQVESGRQWWMGDDVTRRLAGWTKVEEFYYLGGGRPQPKDRDKKCAACGGTGSHIPDGERCMSCSGTGRVPSVQQHAHGRPSKLLIFQRPGRS